LTAPNEYLDIQTAIRDSPGPLPDTRQTFSDDSQEPPPPTRRQRKQAETRREILEAALGAFAAQGFQQTRMSDIAEAAGFTAASLYTYFKSKRDIVLGCEELLTDEMREAFGPIPESPEPDRGAFVRAFTARVESFGRWCRTREDGIALFWRLRWTGDPDIVGQGEADFFERASRLLSHVAALLQALGLERYSWLRPDEAAGVLLGAVEGAIVRQLMSPESPPTPVDTTRITRIVLFGLIGGEGE